MADIASGNPAVDRYLDDGFERVRGMSSRFAAAICAHTLTRQSALGITGDVIEIGTFEGRFFIAMALALQEGEKAIGIDVFNWPDAGVLDRFLGHCAAHGLPRERVIAWKADTQAMTAEDLRAKLAGNPARFIHIDGEHTCDHLTKDLELAHAVLHPSGIICLDDMLHPGYPTLIVAVIDYLKRHPEMRVVCIIDREDIVAAAKFMICRIDAYELYEQDLMTTYQAYHFVLGADMMGHFTLVLTPNPRIAEV